jgi:hypothetical protein
VPVVIKCEIRRGKDLVKELGDELAPELPLGGPKATPFPGNFSFDFVMEQPGTYKAECFTPADEDNYILNPLDRAGRDADAAPAAEPECCACSACSRSCCFSRHSCSPDCSCS